MKKMNRIRIKKSIHAIPIILIVFFIIFLMAMTIVYYSGNTLISDGTPHSLENDKNGEEHEDGNDKSISNCLDNIGNIENSPDKASCPHEQTEANDSGPENNTKDNNNSSTSDNRNQQTPATTQQPPATRTPDTSTSSISKEDMSGCWKLDNTHYAVMCYKGNMQGVNYKWSSAYMEILNGKIVTTENDGWWPSGQIYGWSKYLGTIFGDAKLMSSKYSAKYQKPKLYITLNGITYGFTKTSDDTVSHPALSSSFLDDNGTPYSQSNPAYNETTISIEPGFTKTIYLHKEKGWFFDLQIWESINNGSSITVEFLGKRGDDYAFRISVPRSPGPGYILYFPGARLRVEC